MEVQLHGCAGSLREALHGGKELLAQQYPSGLGAGIPLVVYLACECQSVRSLYIGRPGKDGCLFQRILGTAHDGTVYLVLFCLDQIPHMAFPNP
jgi:hypothetical protein